MANNTVYLMQAVNLFAGDHDPTASKHLTLTELALPTLQEIYADHHLGGARVAVEWEVGIQKLEATLKLSGFDPDLLTRFGLGARNRQVFTAYGVIADKRSGRMIEGKAIMEGRLGKVAPEAFQRGQAQSHD